ncbi:MAG: DUF2271 domain-containing protein [Opitutaceae bacterium]|nr:DUF2271 domain-containing protein [Opitutaceae bacterium]
MTYFSISNRAKTLFFLCFIFVGLVGDAVAEDYTFHKDHVLGTSFDLRVVVSSKASAVAAEVAALEEIDRLNAIFNLYDPESEISRLNRTESLVVSGDLLKVIQKCEEWRGVTRNVFSARIGSILQAWHKARESGDLPDRPSLRVQADEIRKVSVFIDSETNTIERPSAVVWATDGIAKGYIIDKAFEAAQLASPDASGMLLDIGGDIRLIGQSSQGGPWTIGVPEPQMQVDNAAPALTVALSQGSIATSGHSARSFEIGGKSYSHIIDTKSGWPIEASHSATVLAPDAATADALATAFIAMSATASIGFVENLTDVECLIYGYDGRQYSSSGWRGRVVASSVGAVSESFWPEGYELSVEYEVPKVKVSKYRAPYFAIWVTDADRKLVKTLAMLGDSLRWTEENYVWWRYARKEPLLVDAISQPSREPGRYRLVWDGTDDFGQPVPQDAYVLNVEASREHGGHTMAKIGLPLYAKKYRSRRKSEGELGSVRIEYAKSKQ